MKQKQEKHLLLISKHVNIQDWTIVYSNEKETREHNLEKGKEKSIQIAELTNKKINVS